MTEVARTETGVMPHGSRLSSDGSRHYSVAMMSDELYEIDAFTFDVVRKLNVHPHAEMMKKHHGDNMMAHYEKHGMGNKKEQSHEGADHEEDRDNTAHHEEVKGKVHHSE